MCLRKKRAGRDCNHAGPNHHATSENRTMAEPTLIRFSRRCNVRGLTFVGGKQMAYTCPHGQYVVHGEEMLSYSDLGKPAQALVVRIEHVDRREIWFVAPAVVKAAINDTPTGARQ
jgi:hypothetical protein